MKRNNDRVRLAAATPAAARTTLIETVERRGSTAIIDHASLTYESFQHVNMALDILLGQALVDGLLPPGLNLADLAPENQREIALAACDSVIDSILRTLSKRIGEPVTLAPNTRLIWRVLLYDHWQSRFNPDYTPMDTIKLMAQLLREQENGND